MILLIFEDIILNFIIKLKTSYLLNYEIVLSFLLNYGYSLKNISLYLHYILSRNSFIWLFRSGDSRNPFSGGNSGSTNAGSNNPFSSRGGGGSSGNPFSRSGTSSGNAFSRSNTGSHNPFSTSKSPFKGGTSTNKNPFSSGTSVSNYSRPGNPFSGSSSGNSSFNKTSYDNKDFIKFYQSMAADPYGIEVSKLEGNLLSTNILQGSFINQSGMFNCRLLSIII